MSTSNESPYLISVGNIHATQDYVVTPAGTWPLAEVTVESRDQTATTSGIPAWAVILVIVFIWFFLLSLLFLLAREERTSGSIVVTVTHKSGRQWVEHVHIQAPHWRNDTLARVSYLQNLVNAARTRWRAIGQ
ncbi:hypothetical protein JVX92_15110 (plasmid) [Microbacterium hominis]|uniref:hypothetical protein n=1 Tax=Microbacterium hominis TaxID=162426 RepID=UPI0019625564|nr:hypothetical protein [Microbacterium hominis]QRY42309.1 hypothetical protein JVX92_15110 [Microbacterium hominis]